MQIRFGGGFGALQDCFWRKFMIEVKPVKDAFATAILVPNAAKRNAARDEVGPLLKLMEGVRS